MTDTNARVLSEINQKFLRAVAFKSHKLTGKVIIQNPYKFY